MELKNQSDHVALLSLMLVGVLTKRLTETGQLDGESANQIHRLVQGVRTHAEHAGLQDLNVLFDNVDRSLDKAHQTSRNADQPFILHH